MKEKIYMLKKKGRVFVMEENKEEKKLNVEEQKSKEVEAKEKLDAKKNLEETNSISQKDETTQKNDTITDNDNAKFKKVEGTSNKKKSHKILKAILIIIGILIVVYFIFVMRNVIIVDELLNKANNYKNITNYSYEYTSISGSNQTVCKVVSKDNVKRVDIENVADPLKNIILWRDNNTGESILSFPNRKTAITGSIIEVVANLPFELATIGQDFKATELFSLVYSEEYNEKDCYVICIGPDFKKWVEKDTGLVLKSVISKDSRTEITNVKTEDIDNIYKPDLTGFEITEKVE